MARRPTAFNCRSLGESGEEDEAGCVEEQPETRVGKVQREEI